MRPVWGEFENSCILDIKPNGNGGRKVIITHEPTGITIEKILEGEALNFKAIDDLYTELEDKVKTKEQGGEVYPGSP